MGNTGGIKEILVSLSDFIMEPISGLYFNMLAIMAFYKIRLSDTDEPFSERDEKASSLKV
jgi:hypothetical protein